MSTRFVLSFAMALAITPLAAAQSATVPGSSVNQRPGGAASDPVAGPNAEKGVLALADRLDLQIEASKPAFALNEAIAVHVSLNRPAFIYLYSNEADGTSRLLYPSAARDRTKVARRTRFLTHNLISDRAGQISIIAFATLTPLDLAGSDAFLRGAPTKDWEDQLARLGVNVGTKVGADAVAGVSTPKALTLWVGARNGQNLNAPVSDPEAAKPDAVVTAAQKPSVEMPNRALKVATDRSAYKLGENVDIAIFLDQPGWAHLFVAYPDGRVDELTKQSFEAPGTKILKAVATAPAGEQVVVAVYSADGKIDSAELRAAIKVSPTGFAGKGLGLREGSGAALLVSASSFKIEE